MAINFRGYLFDDAGNAIQGATVQLLQESDGAEEASTTTSAAGLWYFDDAADDSALRLRPALLRARHSTRRAQGLSVGRKASVQRSVSPSANNLSAYYDFFPISNPTNDLPILRRWLALRITPR